MSQHTAGRSRELQDAFHVFSRMSLQLESSYRDLEQQVARLTGELAAARSERLLQLAETERLAQRLAKLLETLPGGVVVLDARGVVAECNPAAVTLLGEPLLGQPWHAVMQRACIPQSGGEHGDITLHNGRQITLGTRALEAEAGQILLLTDVTETRALQQLVDRQQRLSAMGEMAASLAHQIRTPLAAALLYLSHLERPQLAQDDRTRVIDKIHARLRHLEHLVTDMLVFARGGAGGSESVALDDLLNDLKQTLEPQLPAVQGTLTLDHDAPGCMLQGSRAALAGALLNLAGNALQACGTGVCLHIEIRRSGADRVQIDIRDNGPGIPAEVRERIFEPFFTTRPDGTGLGLAVVRAVIEAHHGSVQVDSQPGTGACFTLTLPCSYVSLQRSARRKTHRRTA